VRQPQSNVPSQRNKQLHIHVDSATQYSLRTPSLTLSGALKWLGTSLIVLPYEEPSDHPYLVPHVSTAVNETQSQTDRSFLSTLVDDEQHRTSRTSRSPATLTRSTPVAEYQEWPFQGFLKRTRIGEDITYNLEFKLPAISDHLRLPINPDLLKSPSREALASTSTPSASLHIPRSVRIECTMGW